MIEKTPTEVNPADPQVPNGTVIETPEDQPNEVIVYDYDHDGNLIGWHKEVVNG